MSQIFQAARDTTLGLVWIVFAIAWTFGGFIGAIYWAIKGDLLAVVLSIFIPLYGAISVVLDLFF